MSTPWKHDVTEAKAYPPFAAAAIACTDADPEIFFPLVGEDPRPALRVCHSCPARRACRDFAIETEQRFGIWGGTTPAQRRWMLRGRR